MGLNIKKVRRQNMKSVVVASLACFVMLVMASGAFAQPCEDDIANFCKDVKPGQGRLSECLDQHKIDLSDKCRTRFEDVKQEFKEKYKECEDDIMIFCTWIQPGEGRLLNCLKENKSQLHDDCKDNVSRGKLLP
jgi:golgi apparatus protein 1